MGSRAPFQVKAGLTPARGLCLELHGDTAMEQPVWEALELLGTPRVLAGSAFGQEQGGEAEVQLSIATEGRWEGTGVLCLLVAGDTCGMSVPPLRAPGWHGEHPQCLRLGLCSSHGCSPSWCLQPGCGRESASWERAGRRNSPARALVGSGSVTGVR